jgi:hypothetical protein
VPVKDGLREAQRAVGRAGRRQEAEQHERTRGAARRAAIRRTRDLRALPRWRRFLVENGLTLVSTALFLVTLVGLVLTGAATHNAEQRDHGQQTLSVAGYLRSGAFLEAVAENWESEFLQMGVLVVLTAMLYQRGSAESKHIEEPEAADADPREARDDPEAPWPVRVGGAALAVYRHSLSIALFALFAISFALHAVGGAREFSEQQVAHGGQPVTSLQYVASSRFWFESLQNWQSEFMSVAVLVLLTVWLREQGSAQSKPVAASSGETGH